MAIPRSFVGTPPPSSSLPLPPPPSPSLPLSLSQLSMLENTCKCTVFPSHIRERERERKREKEREGDRKREGHVRSFARKRKMASSAMVPKASMPIIPREALGPFKLGTPFPDVIHYLQTHGMKYRNNSILFDPDHPFREDIVVCLHDVGVKLRFEPRTQRLRVIEVFDFGKGTYVYCGAVLGGEAGPPSFRSVYDSFGPTYPAKFDSASGLYRLIYPGICFEFPGKDDLTQAPKELETNEWMSRLAEGDGIVASRFLLHCHSGLAPRLPTEDAIAALPKQLDSDFYCEAVVACVHQGLYFSKRNRILGFDSFAQDCLVDLGPPMQVYVKTEDKMAIHYGQRSELSSHAKDYFFNYFAFGLDVLFDGTSHAIKKFILHTNDVSAVNFNQYRKCNFSFFSPSLSSADFQNLLKTNSITLSERNKTQARRGQDGIFQTIRTEQPSSHSPRLNPAASAEATATGASTDRGWLMGTTAERSVSSDSTWAHVQSVFGPCGPPMVHDAGVHDSQSTKNRFRRTQYYAYDGVLFQVMQNNYLAGVTLLR